MVRYILQQDDALKGLKDLSRTQHLKAIQVQLSACDSELCRLFFHISPIEELLTQPKPVLQRFLGIKQDKSGKIPCQLQSVLHTDGIIGTLKQPGEGPVCLRGHHLESPVLKLPPLPRRLGRGFLPGPCIGQRAGALGLELGEPRVGSSSSRSRLSRRYWDRTLLLSPNTQRPSTAFLE